MIAVYVLMISGGFILGVLTTFLSLMFGFKESKPNKKQSKKQLLKG